MIGKLGRSYMWPFIPSVHLDQDHVQVVGEVLEGVPLVVDRE